MPIIHEVKFDAHNCPWPRNPEIRYEAGTIWQCDECGKRYRLGCDGYYGWRWRLHFMTIEGMAAMLLQERGYIVMSSPNYHKAGAVVRRTHGISGTLNARLVVVAETDWEDCWEQHRRIGYPSVAPRKERYFYRTIPAPKPWWRLW